MPISRRTAGTSAAVLVGCAVLALLAVWLWPTHGGTPAVSAGTSTGTQDASAAIRGYVFYDKNDNGVRDPGEPGIAGIRIRDKSAKYSTLTGADGSYSFPSLPKSGYLQVETGWFRSQCPAANDPTATSCAAGPGPDSDFLVDNQFIRYPLPAARTSDVNVGLLPDWPGRSMTVPAPVDDTVPANPVDVAVRLSWTSGTCIGVTYAICRAGDTFSMAGQVFNQGTSPLTGIRARVYVPPGDCATGVSLLAYTVPAGLGDLTVTPAAPTCADRYVDLSFGGTLVPAADVRVQISGETESGPGTPGCTPSKPGPLCPTQEPQGRGWLFGISHIDQTGDPDSTFCAAGDMTQCPLGLHDKRRAPDEIDPAGHNVDAGLGGSTAYNLVSHVEMLDADTVRAWVSNDGPNLSPEKVQVQVWLPAGTTVVTVPPKHTLITCDGGVATGTAVVVTCTLGGPVAPTLSSPAVDVTLSAAPEQVVVCAVTPAGSPAETVPGDAGCGLSTDTATTPTDNDAGLTG